MGKGSKFGVVVVVALALSWAIACGTSNDQGISFRIAGFKDTAGGTHIGGVSEALACSTGIFAAVIVENNLIQGIRVDRIDMNYDVSGSSLSIPGQTQPSGIRLGPSSGQEPNNASLFDIGILLVPAEIVQFLNDNRNRLPRLPFGMVVTVRATGVTDSGKTFVSNASSLLVEWLDDEFCFVEEEDSEEDESEA